MIERSDEIKDLAAALSAVQAGMEAAKRSSENPFFRSKYADLASVWDACRQLIGEHGLAVTQLPCILLDGFGLHTMLMHTSGQWIASTTPIIAVKQGDPQAFGSALTYARRYALASILGVSTEDDDGNAAAQAPTAKGKTAQRSQPSQDDGKSKRFPDLAALFTQAIEMGYKDEVSVLSALGCEKNIDVKKMYPDPDDAWTKLFPPPQEPDTSREAPAGESLPY